MFSMLKRLYNIIYPPEVNKVSDPLRFGILGAANIAPIALILAARDHPEVTIAAVAARDEQKARKYAKKHRINKVYFGPTGYQELITDPNIDVIYNPLPNGLHFEWTAKALAAGKHVLLEKPSTNTAEETRKLFEIANRKGLVLLEAFHYRFHPAFRRLAEIVQSEELGKIKVVKASLGVPSGMIKDDDIRCDFSLGGGALMDMGTYTISVARALVSAEPTSVLTATYSPHRDPHVDRSTHAVLAFPDDVTAEIACDLQMPWHLGIIPQWPQVSVTVQLEGGEVSLYNFPAPYIYHNITVKPKNGKQRIEKLYKPKEGKGEEWWTTYRYQLEAFVDKVKGRTPHAWMTGEDSVNQMKAIEMVYEKLGIPVRPQSEYVP